MKDEPLKLKNDENWSVLTLQNILEEQISMRKFK
jgi:hypothetical protein